MHRNLQPYRSLSLSIYTPILYDGDSSKPCNLQSVNPSSDPPLLFWATPMLFGWDEQVQQLDAIQKKGLLGCFALTEKLAGVSWGWALS